MGTVWDRTAEFLTDNLTAIVPIALLAFFVPLSVQGNFAHVRNAASPGLAMTLQIVSLGFAMLVVWGSLSIVAMVLADRLGASEQTPGAIATRRLPAALIVWIAVFLVVMGLPALAIDWFGDDDWRAAMLGASAGDMIGLIRSGVLLYFLLITIPLLFLCSRLVLVFPLIVQERRWFGAITRSVRLTTGLTLPIVGVMLLYLLISFAAVLATQAVFGSVFQLLAGAPTSPVSLSVVLTTVMVAAVQTGFTVIAPAFCANLYVALIQREAATGA